MLISNSVKCPMCNEAHVISEKNLRRFRDGAKFVKVRCENTMNQYVVNVNQDGILTGEKVKS